MDSGIIKIVRGAGILFVSGILSYIFKFFYKLLVSRYLGPEDFGLFSLGMMVVNIFSLLTAVGLNNGVVKFIAHYNSLQDRSRVKGTILASLKISFIIGSAVALLLITASSWISEEIFHNKDFQIILIIAAFTIPFFTQLKLLGKSFTAFKRPEYGVYSGFFGREVSSLLLAVGFILISSSVLFFSFSFLISIIFGLVLSFYFLEKKVFPIFRDKTTIAVPEYKELLSFSLPLFLSAIFIDIVGWSDSLLLGYFKDATAVGIYGIALSLAGVIIIFLTTFSHMFFPIVAGLLARHEVEKIGIIFSTVSRWIFLLSLPFFLLLVLFPTTVIQLLFGQEYVPGAFAAVILLMGTFSSVITGPTEEVLKTFEKLRFIVFVNVTVAAANIFLNVLLIPLYGLEGAAIATTATVVSRELVLLLKTRKLIHFRYQLQYYVKYLLSGLIASGMIYFYYSSFGIPNVLIFSLLSIVFVIIYFTSAILLKSIAPEDKEMITVVENRFGINLTIIKKILR